MTNKVFGLQRRLDFDAAPLELLGDPMKCNSVHQQPPDERGKHQLSYDPPKLGQIQKQKCIRICWPAGFCLAAKLAKWDDLLLVGNL